jgi:hypothetical protein
MVSVPSIGQVGLCTLSADPDPLCTPGDQNGESAHCDQNILTECRYGYAVHRTTCRMSPNSSYECAAYSTTGTCTNGVVSEEGYHHGVPP